MWMRDCYQDKIMCVGAEGYSLKNKPIFQLGLARGLMAGGSEYLRQIHCVEILDTIRKCKAPRADEVPG